MNIYDKLKVVVWNVGFIEKSFDDLLDSDNISITWMKHKYTDRFFADPFLLSINDNYLIILAEEYKFIEGKGKIVKLFIDKETKELKKRVLLIETDYHMSYPFIYNNSIIAEQSASGKWIKYDLCGKKLDTLAECGFIDGTIFNDGKTEWLFATKIERTKADACRKLFRYKMKSGRPMLDTEYLVKNDLIASRPGGNFIKYNDQFYRVAQTSSELVYGESIGICRIDICTDLKYKETFIKTVSSSNMKRFNKGLHTFNVYDGLIVVDGFELQSHPIQKIVYKLRKNYEKK